MNRSSRLSQAPRRRNPEKTTEIGNTAIAAAVRKKFLVSRPTNTETTATVGKATQKNKTHPPLMKTCHRFVIPTEFPVINLPKSVCRSTNNVPSADKIELRINPAVEANTARSIYSSARLYNERMQWQVISPLGTEQNERMSHLDD